MPRLNAIHLTSIRAEQLHQLALEDYRSVQQQASYLLDRAIAQAIRQRITEHEHTSAADDEESAYAPRFAFALDTAVCWGSAAERWTVCARRWTEAGRTPGSAEYGITRVSDGQWQWVLEGDLRQAGDAP